MSHTDMNEGTSPIDIVESMAELYDWNFERHATDKIAFSYEGSWGEYTTNVFESVVDETVRILMLFPLKVEAKYLGALAEVLGLINQNLWVGNLTYWAEREHLTLRHGLITPPDSPATSKQLSRALKTLEAIYDRYSPVIMSAASGSMPPKEAMLLATSHQYGRA